MNKKFKVILSAMLVLTAMAGLTGCGNKAATTEPTATTGAETDATKEVEKPASLAFAINVGLKVDDGFDAWKQEYIKKTGINLDFTFNEGNEYYQKMELAFASGQTADVLLVGNDKVAVYAGQGALVDVTDMVANSEVLSAIDPELLDAVKVNGKLYGVPIEQGGGTVTYMRQDWLDQLGLGVPTNYEEFITALRGFKTIQPDAIPFTAPGLVADQAEFYLREFYQDASPEFVKVDGKWVDGMLQPNMVDALTRMRDAYAEGLIDVEVITNKTSTCRDKWYAGQVGTFTYWAGNWNASLENRVQEVIPTAKVTAIPAIAETNYIKRAPAVLSVSSLSKQPEAAFKYLIEYANDGAEGSTLFQHGVEGMHYNYDATGKVVALPRASKPEELTEKAFVTPALAAVKVSTEGYSFDMDPRISASLAVLDEYGVQAEIVPISKTLSKANSTVLAAKEQAVASIVMGQVSVEEGLAKYKAEMENVGIEKIIEELNANQ